MQKQSLLLNLPTKKRQLPGTVLTGNVVDHNTKYGKQSQSIRVSNSFTPTPSKSKDNKSWNRNGGSDEKYSNKQGKLEKFDAKSEKKVEILTLSGTQKQVLDIVMQRKSVFFTGAAGTGKSYILRILQDVMDRLEKADKIAFTASTGVAACNIRGLTIHSWAGIGRATDSHEMIIAQVRRNSNARARWKDTEILVIDEISMLSGELLDLLSRVGRDVRGDSRPFGGMQVILCGDFFQLPPIGLGGKVHFCFESDTWKQLFQSGGMVVLDTVFRQKDDATFLNILNEMRIGTVSSIANQVLTKRVRECNDIAYSTSGDASTKDTIGEVRPTKLFATNKDVDSFNTAEMLRLSQLGGEGPDSVQRYTSIDEGVEPYLQQLKQGTKAPEFLELRVGAQVMLLKNLDTARGLVNGARGTVIGFESGKNRSVNYAVLPLVKFNVVLGSAPMEEITIGVVDDKWDTKLGDRILASRIQLPLMLAWAISIHKSQGMTIPLLEVSFNNIFEYGQGYVALSRATCLAGLTLRSFAPQAIKAHFQVKEFYRQLSLKQSAPTSGSSLGPSTCTTTLELLANTFVDQLPEGPPAADDGWIDTKKNITSGLNAAVHNIVVKQAPVVNGYGQQPQYPSAKAVKYEDQGAYGPAHLQTPSRTPVEKSDNPFDGHRYDEWLEGPASDSNIYNRKIPDGGGVVEGKDENTTVWRDPYAQTQPQFSSQYQSTSSSSDASSTQLGSGAGSQRQPVTLGGFFSSTPAVKKGLFTPSSSSNNSNINSNSGQMTATSSLSSGTIKMASIFGSQVSPTASTQQHNNNNNNNNNNNSGDISRLISSQQSSQPSGSEVVHTSFAANFNPYAKVAAFNHTVQARSSSSSSSSSINNSGGGSTITTHITESTISIHNAVSKHSGNNGVLLSTGGGGGEVRIADLSEDLKKRIEDNRQMALLKQKEIKQRREEEMQRTMQEHRL